MNDDIDAYVDAAAELAGLSIGPYREGVIRQFATIAAMAKLVADHPLPPEIEAAPVLRHD